MQINDIIHISKSHISLTDENTNEISVAMYRFSNARESIRWYLTSTRKPHKGLRGDNSDRLILLLDYFPGLITSLAAGED